MREYIGRRHIAQPQPPKSTKADRFFWRGFRWGLVAGALPWIIVGFGIAATMAQFH